MAKTPERDKAWKKRVGSGVRRCRDAAGMTQAELGKAAGVDWTTISKIERGETSPDFATIEAVADSLGVSIDELVGRVPADPSEAAEPPVDVVALQKFIGTAEDFQSKGPEYGKRYGSIAWWLARLVEQVEGPRILGGPTRVEKLEAQVSKLEQDFAERVRAQVMDHELRESEFADITPPTTADGDAPQETIPPAIQRALIALEDRLMEQIETALQREADATQTGAA